MSAAELSRALGSEKRPAILGWLRDPVRHFPPQRDGDLVEEGVRVMLIAEKPGVAAPTATRHPQVLSRAGLVTGRRIGQWTFHRLAADPMGLIERELGGGR
jgi:DNA-binding transcriptional ArsR family regulator